MPGSGKASGLLTVPAPTLIVLAAAALEIFATASDCISDPPLVSFAVSLPSQRVNIHSRSNT